MKNYVEDDKSVPILILSVKILKTGKIREKKTRKKNKSAPDLTNKRSKVRTTCSIKLKLATRRLCWSEWMKAKKKKKIEKKARYW